MSASFRVARGALTRGINLRCLSQWTLPTANSAATAAKANNNNNNNPFAAAKKYISSTSISSSNSGGSLLTQLAKENPYKDVVRYEFKNRKWNLQHVDFYSEAMAVGLLENGLQPGDVVLSWLPAHFSESVSRNKIVIELKAARSLQLCCLVFFPSKPGKTEEQSFFS